MSYDRLVRAGPSPPFTSRDTSADAPYCAGFNEKRCAVREYLGLYNNIITIGTYSGPAPVTPSDAVRALKRCVIEHPALSTSIRYAETEKFHLVRPATVDLSQHLYFSESTSDSPGLRQHVLERLLNQPVTEYDNLPQWRAHLIRLGTTFHLAFVSSHTLTDGMSGYAFHHAFLGALRGLPASDMDDGNILPIARHCTPLPALEKAGHLSISWCFLLRPVLEEYLPKPFTRMLGIETARLTNSWFGASTRPRLSEDSDILPTAVRVVSVPGSVTKTVVATCRSRNARLTGLLNFLVARCLSRRLHKRGQTALSFRATTPVNLRLALGVGEGKMANYVSEITETISIDADYHSHGLSEFNWQDISRMTSRLNAASKTLLDQPVGLLRYLSNFRKWTLKTASHPSDTSFEVSNLGVFDRADASSGPSEWIMEQMLFSQSANGTGPPLNFNIASAKGGDLTITVTWWRGMLGVFDEEVFVEEVCDALAGDLIILAA